MARSISKLANVKELRLLLCQSSAESKGVRNFIENHYVEIKKANPKLPILVRECQGIEPKLYARYAKGKETCYCLKDKGESEILETLNRVAQSS